MTAVKFTNKKQKQIKQGRTKQETVSIMKLDFHGFPRLARWPRRKGLTLELRKKQTSAISINSLVLVSILLSQSRFRKINGTCSSPVVQLTGQWAFLEGLSLCGNGFNAFCVEICLTKFFKVENQIFLISKTSCSCNICFIY